jgi:hypothetical protein
VGRIYCGVIEEIVNIFRSAMKLRLLIFLVGTSIFFQSCYRNNIQFGTIPENGYTRIAYVDTVEARLSTVVTDSFATNNATSYLVGKYKDPWLGIISAVPYMQMTVPSPAVTIPTTAQYDSACFIIRFNNYYYGDTSRIQTFNVFELNQTIDYTYNNALYNTSSVGYNSVPLASASVQVRPSIGDSVLIKMNDTKGLELFTKLKNLDNAISTQDNFLTYFKGIRIAVNNDDTTAVFGVKGSAGNVVMRVYYHTTTPFYENKYADFTSLANSYSFNQLLTDRSGTGLSSATGSGVKEILSEQSGNAAFTQYGMGVLAKITFPTLKALVNTNDYVRLQKAELIVRPIAQSFDRYKYKLPSTLYLSRTDATNTIGSPIADSTGQATQTVSPVIDYIYGVNSYYRFNVTSYISQLLSIAGDSDYGFFLMQDRSTSNFQADRMVIANRKNSGYTTQLLLTVVIIKK